jgi:hypothetical protein
MTQDDSKFEYAFCNDQGKVPVLFLTEHHVMEAYWGSECIAPRILDVGH